MSFCTQNLNHIIKVRISGEGAGMSRVVAQLPPVQEAKPLPCQTELVRIHIPLLLVNPDLSIYKFVSAVQWQKAAISVHWRFLFLLRRQLLVTCSGQSIL